MSEDQKAQQLQKSVEFLKELFPEINQDLIIDYLQID